MNYPKIVEVLLKYKATYDEVCFMKINLYFTIILMFSSLKYLRLVYHVKWDILKLLKP